MPPPRPFRKLSRAQGFALRWAAARGLYQLRPRLWWTANNTQRIRNPTVRRLRDMNLLTPRNGCLWPTAAGEAALVRTFGRVL
jgi:hypothetical protein